MPRYGAASHGGSLDRAGPWGRRFQLFFRERLQRVEVSCEAAVGTDAEQIWTEGTRVGIDDAIALAFGTSRPRASAPAGLSARELEVARPLAGGLANKAIAAKLHLSVRTVESHVATCWPKSG